EWFSHLLFADEIANTGARRPNEFRELILASLKSRNFELDPSIRPASVALTYRDSPDGPDRLAEHDGLEVEISDGKILRYDFAASVRNGGRTTFKFPVELKVTYHQNETTKNWIPWNKPSTEVYRLESESDVIRFSVETERKCHRSNTANGGCRGCFRVD